MTRSTTALLSTLALLVSCGGNVGDSDGDSSDSGKGAGANQDDGGSSSEDGDGDGAGDGAGADSSMGAGAGAGAAMGSGAAEGSGGVSATSGDGGYGSYDECEPGVPESSQVPRLLNVQYDAVIEDLLLISTLDGEEQDPPSSLLNLDYDGGLSTYSWDAYVNTAQTIAAQFFGREDRSPFIECDPAAAGCLDATIRTFGRKAFRHPLTDDEVARFMRLTELEPQGTADEIAETLLIGFLISPSFLLVPELSVELGGGEAFSAYQLSSYEVATRLSLLLWNSVPDDELNAAADADELSGKEQILEQALRMIGDRKKTARSVISFHQSYLTMDEQYSHWWKASFNPEIFPEYSDAAVPGLKAELNAFFEEVALNGGSFEDLFLSNLAFVNDETAALYGLDPSDYDETLTKVELDAEERPGFLTRAGFLTSFSSYERTSPILRGAFITRDIIDLHPGDHPPYPVDNPVPEGPIHTNREFFEALSSSAQCGACHGAYLDPPGFVLEVFDAVGFPQSVDALGGPIDGSAEVYFDIDDMQTINSPLELMQALAQSQRAQHLYAQKWLSYSTGREANSSDECDVKELGLSLAEDGYTILDLLADLTQTDAFVLRRAEN